MSERERTNWDKRYRQRSEIGEPSPWLISLASKLPSQGRALDIAGGAGRHALWLARRGLDVTLADISCVALEMARQSAEERGLQIETLAVDLEQDPFPVGPWDLMSSSGLARK